MGVVPPLWPLVPLGVIAVIAGAWLFVRAPRMAKGVQAQFYGPAKPRRQPHDDQPMVGDPIGLRSATWRAWGIGLCVFGALVGLIGAVGR